MTHKQVIVLRRDLQCRKGKMCAQSAHASLKAILDICEKQDDKLILNLDDRLKPWIMGLFKKICVGVDSEQELISIYESAKSAGLICSIITDSGLTEFNGVPTLTAVAVGPDTSDKIDLITGHLKLM